MPAPEPGDVVIQSTIAPKNGANFPVTRARDVQGAVQVVTDLTARDALPDHIRVVGLLCLVNSDNTMYRLVGGTTNGDWQAFSSGGIYVRDAFVPTNGQTIFTLSQTPLNQNTVQFIINSLVYTTNNGISVSGTTLTWLDDFPLDPTDTVEAIYVA